MLRVLIADRLAPLAESALEAGGFELHVDPSLGGDALQQALERLEPDVLVVRSTKVSGAMLESAPGLLLVVRAGAGVNTIDLATASRRGIFVCNCPGKNAVAVAELTMGLILSADRQIPNNVQDLRNRRWDKKRYSNARGLAGRTLGLVGLGQIGQEVATRAKAFGMEVLAYSRSLTPARAAELGVSRAESLEALAEGADVISVHLALNAATEGILNAAFFDRMRPFAILVNTARAELVDADALLEAISNKGLRVGLDVYRDEPGSSPADFEHPLGSHPMCFGTHHIGASTEQAQEAVAEEVVRIVETFERTGLAPNCVNLCDRSPATHTLIVPHRDEVGVLANVLDTLRGAGINVQEMDNVVFDGSEAAVARIRLESAPSREALDTIAGHPSVFAARLVALD